MKSIALADGECHVWWATPHRAHPDLSVLLDAEERARCRRLVFEPDRVRYVAAHALARLVLGRYLDHHPTKLLFTPVCKTCGGPHGKPQISNPGNDLEFSLSHSGDQVVVAVARGVRVGVDVEQVQPSLGEQAMADSILSEAERSDLRSLPEQERLAGLFRYWVRKEAALKATGDGLAVSPALLTVSAPDQPARLLQWHHASSSGATVQLQDIHPGEGMEGCVAMVADAPHRVVELDGSWLLRRTREELTVDSCSAVC